CSRTIPDRRRSRSRSAKATIRLSFSQTVPRQGRSGESRALARPPLREAFEVVAAEVPGGLVAGPDVRLGRRVEALVDRGDPREPHRRVGPFRDDLRAAAGAEVAQLARAGLIGRADVFAPRPAEVLAPHPGGGGEGGAVGLLAGAAMAVGDRPG